MTHFSHAAFMAELRKRQGKVPQPLYDDLMASLEEGFRTHRQPTRQGSDPSWLVEARKHLGLKEVPGPQHNPTILGWVKALGGWFVDDETPWCGTFAAHCMVRAGYSVPKHWYRAKAWSSWGLDTKPRVGAVAVFGRVGGGHVGFAVGEDATHLHVLGGNQSNAVNVARIAKSRLIAMRWPVGANPTPAGLPQLLAGGKESRNEA